MNDIMIVAEYWGVEESLQRAHLIGQSGQELTRILAEAGIDRDNDCHVWTLFQERPPTGEAGGYEFFHPKAAKSREIHNLHPKQFALDSLARLYSEIDRVKPSLIVALGNYGLWALTSHGGRDYAKDGLKKSTGIYRPTGIHSWRGSQTYAHRHLDGAPLHNIPVLPIISPADIFRMWDLRAVTVHDLGRASRFLRAEGAGAWSEPKRNYTIPKSRADFLPVIMYLQHILNRLANLTLGPLLLSCDVETHSPLLVCVGFGLSSDNAISIPLVRIRREASASSFESFWSVREESEITRLIRRILTHQNVQIVGQNFLYDTQYLEEEFGVIPRTEFDTMLGHHMLFPGTPKGLDWLSGLYCEHHKYWKDDGKDWHINDDLDSQLRYNALDCCKTIEIAYELKFIIEAQGLDAQWAETMNRYRLAARMTRRGIRRDEAEVKRQLISVMLQKQRIETWLLTHFPQADVGKVGAPALWFDSPTQMMEFFYSKGCGLGLAPVKDKKTGQPSTGKEAMEELRTRYPSLKKLFNAIQALRSLGVFARNFLKKSVDPDGRFRCTYNPAGTETFRFNSTENSFGRGTNMQNIPSGNEE